jgi:putative peptide zinc metalloprotease protein
VAVFVWVNAEPGLVWTVAFSVIAGVGISTLLFNANPLLRFDGYYMLSDWLEIPNLWPRAHRYLGYLCERYGFGRRDALPPAATAGERVWFVIYAVSSFAYRVLVIVGILMFLGQRSVVLGALFGLLVAVVWIVLPSARGLAYLVASPRLRTARPRAIGVTFAAVGIVVAFIGFVPLPDRSLTEGVIWIPEESFVRAGTEGFIERVVASPGARVRRGDTLLVLRDPAILARVAELEARRRELLARYDEQQPNDRLKAQLVRDELAVVERGQEEARRRVRDLTISAGTDGTFVVPAGPACPCSHDLRGRFVKTGDHVGYVVELATVTVRAVVHQGQIDLVRYDTGEVRVRLAERLWDPLPARIRRIVPAATEQLPTTALGTAGGGKVAIDPRDTGGVTAMARLFQIEIELPTASGLLNVGGRAYVRFDHSRRPLAQRWYREIRQLFLERFNV